MKGVALFISFSSMTTAVSIEAFKAGTYSCPPPMLLAAVDINEFPIPN